jgi:branched-chain amino acid aminotransferase
MEFRYFSRNGELRPMSEAVIPLSNIEYQYGFGVYESVRVREGVPYFLAQHIERLLNSARVIGLSHQFTAAFVERAAMQLAQDVGAGTYNLKILLVGGTEPQLFILPLNPHFPDKKLYRDGVHCTTYRYERFLPHAKTLNMFRSYLAYTEAKRAGAYDALFVDSGGHILEGTRTNIFFLKGKTLVTPPEARILAGVTRAVVRKVAAQAGFDVVERDMPLESLAEHDAAFLTSTSSGIMPVASVDTFRFGERPAALDELMTAFDTFIERCGGVLE